MYDFLIGFDTYIHCNVKNKQNFDLFSFKESGLKRVQWIKKLGNHTSTMFLFYIWNFKKI